MDEQHFHYDCPLCSEEAIPERCPAYRIEWSFFPQEEYVMEDMVRLNFLDGTYMNVPREESQYWEMDPSLKNIEDLNEEDEGEEYQEIQNGKRVI